MRYSFAMLMLAVMAVMGPASAQTPAAPPPPPAGPIHVVIYVETYAAWASSAIKALKSYREGALKENGAMGIALLRETTRLNRFLIDETWGDFVAWDAHAKASKLAELLKQGHLAPPDSRTHTEWSVAPSVKPSTAALFLYTHIDVSPPMLAGLQTILKPYIEKSRGDKGVLRFDLLQGVPPRLNHQTLAEVWASEADFVTHQASTHAIEFRDKLGPLLGALYDQRLYRLVK